MAGKIYRDTLVKSLILSIVTIQMTYVLALDFVIGAICRKQCGASNKTNSVHIKDDVTVIYHSIETEDVIDLLKTVSKLDKDVSIDVIVLLQKPSFYNNVTSILKTFNKRLIVWGSRHISIQTPLQKVQSIIDIEPSECVGKYGPYIRELENTRDTETSEVNSLVTGTLFNGPAVVSQLIDHLQWKNAIVIYEESTVFEMSSLIDSLSKLGVPSVIYHVNDIHKLFIDLTKERTMFKPLWNTIVCFNMIVLCRYECARNVILQANEFDGVFNNNRTFLSSLSRWLFVLYDKSQTSLPTTKLHHVLVVHVPENGSNNEKTFLPLLTRILTDNHEDMTKTEIVQTIEKASLHEYIDCEGYKLTTTVWTQTGLEIHTVGYVMPTGQVVIEEELYPNLKYKYNKQMFFVSIIVYPPYLIRETVDGATKYTGLCIDVLSSLADTLNFTYQLSEVPDGNYGVVVNRTTMAFNGLIGQVQRKEVDMVVGDIAITNERDMVMDYTFPFDFGYTMVLIKRLSDEKNDWRKLADPLKWQVFVLVIVTLLLCSVIMMTLERRNPYYTNALKSHPSAHSCLKNRCGFMSFFGSISGLGVIVLNEGHYDAHKPRSVSGRTFFSSWCLFALVIYGTYCGNLIATLSVVKEIKPFNSLSEMVEQSDSYTWGTIGGTLWEQIFMTSTVPNFKAIGEAMRRFNKTDPGILNTNNAHHINKVKNEDNYAFIGDDGSITKALANDCRLTNIRERFIMLTNAFGFPDKSPHAQIFADRLSQMYSSGLIKFLKKKWWRSENQQQCNVETMRVEAKQLTLSHVQSAFYVAAGGLALSAIVFGAELLISKFRQLKQGNVRSRND